MNPKPHWLRDLIACSWWPNDGPILLRPKRVFEADLIVEVSKSPPHIQSGAKLREKMLSILRRFPQQEFLASVLAMRLQIDMATCHAELTRLCNAGLVTRATRDGARHSGKYRLAARDDEEEAEAAE